MSNPQIKTANARWCRENVNARCGPADSGAHCRSRVQILNVTQDRTLPFAVPSPPASLPSCCAKRTYDEMTKLWRNNTWQISHNRTRSRIMADQIPPNGDKNKEDTPPPGASDRRRNGHRGRSSRSLRMPVSHFSATNTVTRSPTCPGTHRPRIGHAFRSNHANSVSALRSLVGQSAVCRIPASLLKAMPQELEILAEEAPSICLSNRIAAAEDGLRIDLGDESWTSILVTRDEYSVVQEKDPHFYRGETSTTATTPVFCVEQNPQQCVEHNSPAGE